MSENRIKKAVILAAGEGQRLRPFTTLKPKPMIPVGGKPVLQHVIEALAQNGIIEIIIVVGYKKENIFDFFGGGENFGVDIEYVTQSQQLGTAHALAQARDKVKGEFLVLPGDNVIESRTISEILELHPPAILLKNQQDISKYGIGIVEDGYLRQLVEKPESAVTHLANTGIYAFSDECFNFLDDILDLPGIIDSMLSSGISFKDVQTTETWLDAVYPWDILQLSDLVLQKLYRSCAGTVEKGVTIQGPVYIGKGSVIRANSYIVGPAAIGEGCDIGPSACIFPTTEIGDYSVISPYSEIRNSVLGEGVTIGTGATIQDSVIDRYVTIGAKFSATSGETQIDADSERHRVTMGAMVGEHTSIGDNVVVSPGIRIGPKAIIKSLKLIDHDVPFEALVV
ncbi:MAG: bifunctional sugar-1-phosphate nucleotidylyltransferase/acetyltransferase [Dehalococcoidia bacterium]